MKFDKDMLRVLMTQHKIMCRQIWCGTGQYIYFCEGQKVPISKWRANYPCQNPTKTEIERGYVIVKGHIDQMNKEGERVIGWHPTKEDLEADDWIIIE